MNQPEQHLCSRRAFLIGSATTFAGALLVACGGEKNVPQDIAVNDVPVGSAVIVDKYIIAQPTEGDYKAYSAVCPHQGAPITVVEGDTVKCTKHGSKFSIKDGSVLNGPAQQPLESVGAHMDNGQIHVG
ncbi:Rieske (2Fe-2S) protein [Corynebacterium pseudopelargi]|uniref:3-phenylpropionate/cinnamic acid dioxygenase ferredoxin subunit n=1 Tax=Corynebacterium pseudopelargi TaxID=2080757 RepID=A0A3G6IX04_9CORY|nr:Rieske 2Fe-2S domain-containing protein [Corynebacterium pseudopelargi]AZA10319.1 3-phenylpropionate/cinnamic acid dioxygenase ferredoxin subunit [Corynebacterium pseudopelargi]